MPLGIVFGYPEIGPWQMGVDDVQPVGPEPRDTSGQAVTRVFWSGTGFFNIGPLACLMWMSMALLNSGAG